MRERLAGKLFKLQRLPLRHLLGILALAMVLGVGPATKAWQGARSVLGPSESISAGEFSRIVNAFSEPEGFFRSDNFVSNETSYLHVVDKLKRLGASGGAYLGVGPEQNFTYIAKIRPRIAFIVDIRRQAVIQHLLFKAIFHLSETRAQFLSILFSKPLVDESVSGPDTAIEEVLAYFAQAHTDRAVFASNLALIRKTIEQDFRFPLSTRDFEALEYVYTAFRNQNLSIQYPLAGSPSGWFPSLQDLILQKDLYGKPGNFFVKREDFEFVRNLEEQNRVIPVVGDFAGPKALPLVADYLKNNGYTVTAFYTSNVEQYLFANEVFNRFAENIRKLPITEGSLFIRAFPNLREPHPAKLSGHRLTTLLQRISVFLQDFDQGLYHDYWSLVTTHFIAGDEP